MSKYALEYLRAHDKSWIRCFKCGRTSYSREDAARLWCANCEKFHTHGLEQEPPPDMRRESKIIVALFLTLGKFYERIGARERNQIVVTEEEIRLAWTQQKSPVRLISETVSSYLIEREPDGNELRAPGGRVFKVVAGDLDLKKTGIDLRGTMPSEPVAVDPNQRKRVFDLE